VKRIPTRRGGTLAWPALLVVSAATVQELGAAFAVGLFAALGVPGTVFVRFAVAGLVLGGLVRPRLRGLGRREYAAIAALALTLTAMNSASTRRFRGYRWVLRSLSRFAARWFFRSCSAAAGWAGCGPPWRLPGLPF
jgi:hypothetical protein